jgi:hypothetical protein
MKNIYVHSQKMVKIHLIDDEYGPLTKKEWSEQLRPYSMLVKFNHGHIAFYDPNTHITLNSLSEKIPLSASRRDEINQLEQENARLKAENERLKQNWQEFYLSLNNELAEVKRSLNDSYSEHLDEKRYFLATMIGKMEEIEEREK